MVNGAAINIRVQVFIWTPVFMFFGYMPICGIAGSQENSMFGLLKNCQTLFHSSCTILHSHKQCMMVPIPPHPLQRLLIPIILFIAILVGVKQHLVVLVCIFLMNNDVPNLFMCLLALVYPLWRNIYLHPLLILKLNCFLFVVKAL